jgi:hypothetical protein
MDAYAILGVGPEASASEIKDAYRARIRAAHPDVTGGDDATAKLLNEAYTILSDPQRRAAHDRGTAATREPVDAALTCPECGLLVPVHLVNAHWRTHLIEQHGALCAACDRYPTRPLRLKSHSGFLLWRTVSEIDQEFCRSCGTGIFREVQARNITRGPWGIISFFSTILALFGNTGRFATFKSGLDTPMPPHPVSERVFEGRPVLLRRNVIMVLGIIVAAIAFVVANISEPSYSSSPPPESTTPAVTRAADFIEGSCVTIDGDWVTQAPSCTGADGAVSAVVADPDFCPSTSPSYIERSDGSFACLLEY